MTRVLRWLVVTASLGAASCVSNTAPGNDREAALDPPEQPAEAAAADEAIAGVDPSLLHPQIITDMDRAGLHGEQARCVFRFTRVGFPVFLYSAGAAPAGIMKLNGKLVTLPGGADGRFASAGVTVELRRVDADAEVEQQHEADLILMLPGAPDELGYRGFSECGRAAGTGWR